MTPAKVAGVAGFPWPRRIAQELSGAGNGVQVRQPMSARQRRALRVCSRVMTARTRRASRRTLNLAVIILGAVFAMPLEARAQNYQIDQFGSDRVTKYLHRHDLPLVGAQILDNNDGSRELHLFGYVGTPYGMQDAQTKALEYLGDPTIKVVNAIQINPSIEQMRPLSSPLPAAANTPVAPTVNSDTQWNKAINNIYKNGAQPLPQPSGPLLP